MSYKVITHNGKAHMDELLAIALLAQYKGSLPSEIIRIHQDESAEILQKEEQDENCYFIDCGLQLDPEKLLFDHHQSKDLGCAALLVFEHFYPELLGSNLHEYIKLVSLVDTLGPSTLDDFKYKSETIYYFSFCQKLLLKQFEQNPILIVSIFVDGLKSMIEFEKEKEIAFKWIATGGNIKIEKLKNLNVLIYNKPPPKEISSAIKAVDGDIVDENEIDVVYSYDKDDERIRTLFRTIKGHKNLDLTFAKVNDTQFCHNSGFLLKFRPENSTEWENILKESILG